MNSTAPTLPDLSGLSLPNLNALLRVCAPSVREEVQRAIDERTGRTDAPASGAESNAFDSRETEVQREIRRAFLRRGAAVYWLSQARRTGQTRGLPDLLVFDPHQGAVFIECKAQGGKPSREQVEFAELCRQAGVGHVLGGMAEVRAFLGAGEVEG